MLNLINTTIYLPTHFLQVAHRLFNAAAEQMLDVFTVALTDLV